MAKLFAAHILLSGQMEMFDAASWVQLFPAMDQFSVLV